VYTVSKLANTAVFCTKQGCSLMNVLLFFAQKQGCNLMNVAGMGETSIVSSVTVWRPLLPFNKVNILTALIPNWLV
jgi:hypothetical protein